VDVVLGGLEQEVEEGLACRAGCTEDCVGWHGGGCCEKSRQVGGGCSKAIAEQDLVVLKHSAGAKIQRCESMTSLDGVCDQCPPLQNPKIAKTVVISDIGATASFLVTKKDSNVRRPWRGILTHECRFSTM